MSIAAGFCMPFNFAWDKSVKGGRCGNEYAAYTSVTVLDVLGDFMIIVLPTPWLWKLKITPWSKIGLNVIFALGFLNITAGILRIVYWDRIKFEFPADTTFEATNGYILSVIEPCLAIIVACAALLRPLFVSCCPSIKRFISFPSRSTNTSVPSWRSNILRYPRHPEKAVPSTDGDELVSREEANGNDYALQPLSTAISSGRVERSGSVGFTSPVEDGRASMDYTRTVVALHGARDDRRRLKKGSGEYKRQQEGTNPYVINVENSYSITSVPKL